MMNKLLRILSHPDTYFYESGYKQPNRGFISEEARLKARAKHKKNKKKK